ncbi:MAG: hypothetical protein COA68_17680 [Oceanobacter sp.]|nr:MAG: hypothetical protein COA68_17680 [Oceanobacter sp.]
MVQLFDRVVEAIQQSPAAAVAPPALSSSAPPTLNTVAPTNLRIVDVWKSRIYNVYDLRVPITTRFEESAEYRVELAPTPIPDVKIDDQVLLHVCHFGRAGNNNGKVVTHSDPFSIFVSMLDTLQSLRERIWTKLGLSEQQVEDWRLSFVHCGKVVEVKSTTLLGEQQLAFGKGCGAGTSKSNGIYYTPSQPLPPPSSTTNEGGSSGSRGQFVDPQTTNLSPCVFHTIGGDNGTLSIFQSNQRDGTQVAFLGLEHAAPLNAKRGLRREEQRSLKIRN